MIPRLYGVDPPLQPQHFLSFAHIARLHPARGPVLLCFTTDLVIQSEKPGEKSYSNMKLVVLLLGLLVVAHAQNLNDPGISAVQLTDFEQDGRKFRGI